MNLLVSLLYLDRTAIKGLRVTDQYSLHRVIYSLFPQSDNAVPADSRILYADKGGDYRSRQILILSDREPLSQIDGRYGVVRTRTLPAGFLDHEAYGFEVIVNPTHRSSASRNLVPVRGRDAIAHWFVQRSPAWGFSVDPERLQVDQVEVQQFRYKNLHEVTIAQAYLRGILQVTERDRFKTSFANGIGRARAFGCGLLQIVPVIENPFFS